MALKVVGGTPTTARQRRALPGIFRHAPRVNFRMFGSVQECYIVRQSRTFWLPWPKNTVKCLEIAGGDMQKMVFLCSGSWH